MATSQPKRVVVTGGGTFIGMNIAAALLAEGADVTLLLRPGNETRLGPLAQRVRAYTADIWDPASLRGRARGHSVLIHTVGSMVADPAQGLTHHRLNFLSARNAANLCISDGVPHMVLLSAVAAPWVSRPYLKAKREAEAYLRRVGLHASIVRAPLSYLRGQPRPLLYRFVTTLGSIPPTSWLGFGQIAPMPLDLLARGVARIALQSNIQSARSHRIYRARDIRRLNRRDERRGELPTMQTFTPVSTEQVSAPYSSVDEELPFGWTPLDDKFRR